MTTQLTTTQKKATEFNEWLLKRLPQIQQAAPRTMKAERFSRIILTEFIVRIPKLQDCTRNSVMGALLQCVILGLEPGIGGQCWILPYNTKQADGSFANIATFVMGYRGFITLGRRARIITHADAGVVCSNDVFEFMEYPRSMRHQIINADKDRGDFVGAWSALHMPGGIDKIDFMTVDDIEKLRNHGKSAKSPAWTNWYDEMAKAKVTKRNFKYMATEDVMNAAITIDDEADMGETQSLPENDEPKAITAAGQEAEEAQFDDIPDGATEDDDKTPAST